jgi:hypothetical protein
MLIEKNAGITIVVRTKAARTNVAGTKAVRTKYSQKEMLRK